MAGNTVYGMVVRAGMWSRVGVAAKVVNKGRGCRAGIRAAAMVVNETVTYAIVALSRRQSLNRTKQTLFATNSTGKLKEYYNHWSQSLLD
jgi:hypothetical protein